MQSKRILGVLVAFIIVFTTFSVAIKPQTYTEALVKIDSSLLEQMGEENGPYKALVKVAWNPNLEPIKFNHDAVIAELKAEAAETQAPVITYLKQKRDAEILNTFWLTNIILIRADEATIRELATLTTVEKVLVNFNITLPEGETMQYITSPEAVWNIEKVRAPEVWEAFGITGEGIRFATSDTGIELGHPDLAGTLWTDDPTDPTYPGGWIEFDANGYIVQGSVPHDTYGHGTATYGVIVGDAANPDIGHVGMAPGAAGLGMHALNLPGGSGTFPQVVAGLQWIIDPVDQYGDPAGAPARVSSHSWGATGYYSELIEPIRDMWYSGHFVCAAIGNSWEGSSGSPGNIYETVGVGATDIDDNVANFPSWGSSGEWVYKTDFPPPVPEDWPEKWIKPEVCAPGVDVIVPYPPDTYVYWGGTSFSSPHVGGAAVLMLSGNPSLTPPEIEAALEETAVWDNRYYPEPPDTRYGWGRIDAYEAVMMVALPQGIIGYVTDAETGEPLSQVNVYCPEADRSAVTDELGYYDMRLLPGTYTLTFSRFGYESQTVPGINVVANQFTTLDVALTPVPPGYVAGQVRFGPTGIGIPGASVEALDVPVTIQAETDVDGYYNLAIPPGTYDFKASAYGFKEAMAEDVVVVEGETTIANFELTQPPVLAVVGDYPSTPGKVTAFLQGKGYTVDAYVTLAAVTPNVASYSTIVVNRPTGSSTGTEVNKFISATDANGVGVLWLDSWASYTGGYLLKYTTGWPPYRYTSYSSAIEHTYYRVTATDDDIIPGWGVGYKIIHDKGVGTDHDHAYYRGVVDGYKSGIGTVKILTNAGYRMYGSDYDYSTSQGIIKVTRDAGNKWVVLSMHANTPWTMVDYWHDDTKTVFLNSINWVAKPHVGIAKFVVWGLKAEPKVGLWNVDRTVSVGIKNVGWITGTDTVKMYVDTILEGTATVTQAPGEYAYPSWTVSRFEVGTYKVSVRHLSTTFTVRPPEITVQAYEFCTSQPLAGADVYGYYRKYVAPGWYEQWSKAYGGYGHSQFAQPIGDLDGDGVNEVVVGGYETLGSGRCRILSYDATTGTYVEEYSWTHGGGTYNSPSGATMLDLDGDGQLELVVSWSYSGANDGVWAYKWDGTTLTPLDHWYGGFVFDVYTCDYDDDGVKEVLVANAPWGATPYHVIALGWDITTGKFVEEVKWLHPSYSGYECMMLWSGDTDNDGKTEVIVSIAYSSSYNGGTFALNWESGTWTYQPVYTDLINGSPHYGVTVGDVDGDGTPEIGIGNNPPGYTGAGAVLVEWDGTAYKKVWEGSWPTEYGIIEAVAIGDVDCDGKNEFCAGGGYVHIIGWTGTEYVEESTITKTSGLLSGVVIGDMDNDGLNELKACDIIGYGPGKEWIFKYAKEPTPEPTWTLKYFGTTDNNGKLVFDSPASVVDMHLFVYKGEKSAKGYEYLLAKYMKIDNDISVTYEPHSSTEAIINSKLKSTYLDLFLYEHLGVTWLQKGELPILWPFIGTKCDPAKIVVTPETYTIRHMLNIEDSFGSWWYYFMAPDRIVTLAKKQTYTYYWAGPIEGFIKFKQVGETVTLQWSVTDSNDHQITGVTLIEANWLTSESQSETMPIPIKPTMLEDMEVQVGKTVEYYPVIALYRCEWFKRGLIKSGFVKWDEKLVTTTTTETVKYVTLSFMSGPYGNPFGPMYVHIIYGWK